MLTRGNGDDAAEGRTGAVQHPDRHLAAARGAIAELAIIIVAPGPETAVGGQRQAEILASGDAADIREPGDQGGLAAVLRGAVAELAVAVVAPGEHAPIGAQRQRMAGTGGDQVLHNGRGEGRVGAMLELVHVFEPIAVGIRVCAGGREVAEGVDLPFIRDAVAIAVGGIARIVGEGICSVGNAVTIAVRDRIGGRLAHREDRIEIAVDHLHRETAIDGGAVAELELRVPAPGEGGEVLGNGDAMLAAGVDAADAGEAGDGGNAAVAEGTLAELARVVAAPAEDLSSIIERETVPLAGREIRKPRDRDAEGIQRGHRQRAIHGEAVPELAVVVVAPGQHAAGAGQRQSVPEAGGDVDDAADGQAASVQHPLGAVAAGRGAVADLTLVVGPPGPNGAVAAQRQAVVLASGHRDDARQHVAGSVAHLDRGVLRGSRAVAELTVTVVAPGQQRTVVEQRQAVIRPGGDGDDIGERVAEGIQHVHRVLTAGAAAVAELAIAVVAPGDDRAVRQHRQRMVATGGDILDVVDEGAGIVAHEGGIAAIGAGTVAELAIAVVAPGVESAVGALGQTVVPARGDGRRRDERRGVARIGIVAELVQVRAAVAVEVSGVVGGGEIPELGDLPTVGDAVAVAVGGVTAVVREGIGRVGHPVAVAVVVADIALAIAVQVVLIGVGDSRTIVDVVEDAVPVGVDATVERHRRRLRGAGLVGDGEANVVLAHGVDTIARRRGRRVHAAVAEEVPGARDDGVIGRDGRVAQARRERDDGLGGRCLDDRRRRLVARREGPGTAHRLGALAVPRDHAPGIGGQGLQAIRRGVAPFPTAVDQRRLGPGAEVEVVDHRVIGVRIRCLGPVQRHLGVGDLGAVGEAGCNGAGWIVRLGCREGQADELVAEVVVDVAD